LGEADTFVRVGAESPDPKIQMSEFLNL
jgi:hypothetical protein